jgi:hypothetical protein
MLANVHIPQSDMIGPIRAPAWPSPARVKPREQLLQIADTMPLAPMAAPRERKVRAFVKETVGDLPINKRTN